MLMFLLKNPGVVVTKDELLAAVWPNRVITDSALNKQITQLRKTFDDEHADQSIIETVRGVGVRLVVDVTTTTTKLKTSPPFPMKVLLLTALVILTAWLLYQFYLTKSQPAFESTEVIGSDNEQAINVVIIPAEKTNEWLDIGGLMYLSELLRKHDAIEAISPQIEWFNEHETNILALQLSQSENIDYALVIDNIDFQDKYVAKLKLRNSSGILAAETLQAQSLNLLFNNVDQWAIQQLSAISNLKLTGTKPNNTSDFVLQSYLRGLASAGTNQYRDAENLLQTAVNQDPAFFPAWLTLAEVEAELGHFQKAFAMTESIENMPQLSEKHFNDLLNVKARVLIYLNRFEDAESTINKSIQLSIQNDHKKAWIDALSNQVKLHDRTGVTEATLSNLNQLLSLVQLYNPLPSQIAKINHNLAIAQQNFNNFDQAQIHIDQAIEQFKAFNNYNALVASYNVKANIHNILGETAQSLLILEKSEKWLPKIDSIITKGVFLRRKASNSYEQGFKTQAQESINKLLDLSVEYQLLEAKIMALIVQVEMQISYRQFTEAHHTTEQLLSIIKVNPSAHPTYNDYIIAIDMYLSARNDKATIARDKMDFYLSTFPELADSLKPYLPRIEAHIIAKEGFKSNSIDMLQQLMQTQIESHHLLDASYIGYELLDLMWQHDMPGFIKTTNRIEEISGFDYPILKYRAQYLAAQKDFLNATILMQELKSHAREYWTHKDQLILETYQHSSQTQNNKL